MANLLVVGSFAIDYVGTYPGNFDEMPDGRASNTSIQLDGLRRGFGGCAMNIAVALKKLGHSAVPFAYVGSAIDPDYKDHLVECGIDMTGLQTLDENALPAHALIFTDSHENQITAFYAGPHRTNYAQQLTTIVDDNHFDFVLIAPDQPEYMLIAATLCNQQGIPFIADPGQCISAFSPEECRQLIEIADMLCVNKYEYDIVHQHKPDVEDRLEYLFITHGENGVRYKLDGRWYSERAAKPKVINDPTGCGDAFRAGLIHGHMLGASWHDSVRAGCVLASINIEHEGTQLHSLDKFSSRYEIEWQTSPAWMTRGEVGV